MKNKQVSFGLLLVLSLVVLNSSIVFGMSGSLENREWSTACSKGCTEGDVICLEKARLIEADILSSLEKGYTTGEVRDAAIVKVAHDAIEIAAYDGFVEGIQKLGITTDQITEEQSKTLLHKYVKNPAHVVMRGKGGYNDLRVKHLKPSQVSHLLEHLAHIVHDRDSRLTHATYTSLTELVFALDDHNNQVNEIIFKSWWGCRLKILPYHLGIIKKEVRFYERLSKVLSFDLENAINVRMNVEKNFPKIAEKDPHTLSNQILVHSYFTGTEFSDGYFSFVTKRGGLAGISKRDLSEPLSECLLDPEDFEFLLENQLVSCEITVREFFARFFPAILEKAEPKR